MRFRECLRQWLRSSTAAPVPDCAAIRYWERADRCPVRDDLAPVLFVHGYAGNDHIWTPLRAALAEAGFGQLIALRYNAFRADIHQIADWLVEQTHRSMRATGADGVHLIGHSMGGLVVRDAVQARGLGGFVTTAVTIATPHAGTALARLVPGPSARQMRPGSDFLAELGNRPAPGRTRWVVIHGGADRVVPECAGLFRTPSATVVRLRQDAAGHGSIARHPAVVAGIVTELLKSEDAAMQRFSLAA